MLRFTDNTTQLIRSTKERAEVLDQLQSFNHEVGLAINRYKSILMLIHQLSSLLKDYEEITYFQYFGSMKTCRQDISRWEQTVRLRIAAMIQLNKEWKDHYVTTRIKGHLVCILVYQITTYSCTARNR